MKQVQIKKEDTEYYPTGRYMRIIGCDIFYLITNIDDTNLATLESIYRPIKTQSHLKDEKVGTIFSMQDHEMLFEIASRNDKNLEFLTFGKDQYNIKNPDFKCPLNMHEDPPHVDEFIIYEKI